MNNILLRSLTGAVFISIVLLPLFWRAEAAAAVFGMFMVLSLIEFYRMLNKHPSVDVPWELGLTLGVSFFGLFVCVFLGWLPLLSLLLVLPLAFLAPAFELWRKKANPLLNIAALWMGLFYVALPFVLMTYMQVIEYRAFPLLAGMFLLIWMNDTFAYLSGRFFGKHKLLERISPNKTWEGTIGGIVFTILGSLAIGFLFDSENILFWTLSALLIAPCSVLGDLLESMLKRNAGVKDSGTLLPGHGGVLDRFDATLFTVPFFLTWASIYQYI